MEYIGDVVRMREIDLALPYYVSKRKGILLDVGAADGVYKSICEKHGYAYCGIDKNYEYEKNNVWKMDLFGVISLNVVFDCILLVDVLEHIKEDKQALKIMNKILRPGGFILIHVPNKDSTHLLCTPQDNDDHARRGYSSKGLSDLLEESGFKIFTAKATFEIHDALMWDIFWCMDYKVIINTEQIRELVLEKRENFIPYGLLVLAEKLQ